MLYCTVMKDKGPDSSYNHSHEKNVKSFEKALDIKQRIGQNSQLHSFTASQLHSFTASQLRARHARIINSQPNTHQTLRQQAYRTESFLWCAFFILHRLIKPQRAQNPQRIIKECLTKPLLKHLASLACSAVKLKNIRRQRNA